MALTEARRAGVGIEDAQAALADAKVEQTANALALKVIDAAMAGRAQAPGAAASGVAAAASEPALSIGAIVLGSMTAALWRTVVLLCVCGLVLALFVLFIIALTMG